MTAADPVTPSAPESSPNTSASQQTRERRPYLLCVLCFVTAALPAYVVLAGPLKGNGSPARMIAMVMLGLVILGFLTLRRAEAVPRINPGVLILLFFLFLWLTAYGVGLLQNDSYTIATNRTRAALTLLANVGVGLYILTRRQTARQRDLVLGCLAAGLAFACLVGFLQGTTSIDLRYLFQPPGFVLNTTDLQLSERLGTTRVRGTSQHPIEFSVLAAVTIPLTIYFARNASTSAVRVVSLAGCGLAILALPAAVSRTGVISVLVALLVYMFAFKVRSIVTAVAVGAAAIGVYIAAFPHVVTALWRTITGSAEDASVEGRFRDYAKVSDLLHEHPWFGLGLGGSEPTEFGYLDNEWLQAVVQGGFTGLTAMIVLSAGVLFGFAAALRRATSQREREQAYMLGAMAAGILASSYTFDLFSYQQTTLIFFIVFGLLWSGFDIAFPLGNRDLLGRRRGWAGNATSAT